MIQVFADGNIAYDSRLESYDLVSLKVTNGLNIGGTASIVMPAGHPAYKAFTSMRTIVTVYRDGALRFRGRAVYPSDDFYGQRTITCEGERCLLRDGIIRPYLYQDTPANIFNKVINAYNSQVDTFKQFRIGECTVVDENDYIRLESLNAETALDTMDKLIERCGGYLVFTTASDGARVINWYATLNYRSGQVIELGENLLNYTSSASDTDLVTRVHAYGAKFGELRLTLEEINGGLDYIQDDEAVARYGVIARAVYWDDVTVRTNLMAKAQAYLAEHRNIVTSLELSALDLSYLDKSIDSFTVGDSIRVLSKPHGVDEFFQLAQMTEDLLDPSLSSISLGKDTKSLTRADVKGDLRSMNNTDTAVLQVKADYAIDVERINQNTADAIANSQETQVSLIQQTGEAITMEIAEMYATNDQVTDLVSTSMTQLADSFNFRFTEMATGVQENDVELREQIQLIEKYIRFEGGNIILGEVGNELTLRIENDRISFLDAGAEVAYFSDRQLVVLDGHFLNSLRVGSFAWLPRENGNLSLVKVGG